MKFWANHNKASETPKTIVDNDNLKITEWESGTENNGDVRYVNVIKGKHAWFKKSKLPISAAEEFWNFFKAHPKRAIIVRP